MGAVARRERKGNDVAFDARKAADEGVRADPHILMHRRRAADHRMVPDLDVAAQQNLIGQYHVVAQPTVMSDVRSGKKDAARPDTRALAHACIDGHAFANDAIVADRQRALRERSLDILRRQSHGGEGENPGARADARAAADDDMGEESRAVADLDAGADMAKGADGDVGAEPRAVFDDTGRMNR